VIKRILGFLQSAKWLVLLPLLLASFVAVSRFMELRNEPLQGDAGEYFEMGLSIRQTGIMLSPYEAAVSAERGIAYPVLLAPFAGGSEVSAHARVRALNAALFVLCTACVYLLAAAFGNLAGVAAASVWALNPLSSSYAAQGGIEIFYTFCLLLSFLLFRRWLETKLFRWAALAGLGFGFSIICRSVLFVFPPVAAFLAWYLVRPQKRQIAVFLVAACLPVALWAARNARLFGQFVPLERGRANVILFDSSRGMPGDRGLLEVFSEAQAASPAFNALSHEDKLLSLGETARRNIYAHPFSFAAGSVRRAFGMAYIYCRQGLWLIPFVLAGFYFLWRRGKPETWVPYAAVLVYGILVYSPLSVSDRFMLPFFPFYFALASAPLIAAVPHPEEDSLFKAWCGRGAAVVVCGLFAASGLVMLSEGLRTRPGDGRLLSVPVEKSFSDPLRKSAFLVRRGIALDREGNKTAAAQAFEAAEAIKPVNPEAPLSLCALLLEKNKFEDACAACARAADAARLAGNAALLAAAETQGAEASRLAREFPRTSLPQFPEKEKASPVVRKKRAPKARKVTKVSSRQVRESPSRRKKNRR